MANFTLIDSLGTEYIKYSDVEDAILKQAPDKPMNLFTLLGENTVLTNLDATNKDEAIHALIDALKNQIDPDTLEVIRKKVFEREAIMSTGVGKGLAIPHCKTTVVDHNYAAFAKLSKPIDFNSIDKEPVQIVFLLVGPDSKHGEHIKLLSRISRLMNSNSFSEKILNSQTSELIIEAFREEEEKYFVH